MPIPSLSETPSDSKSTIKYEWTLRARSLLAQELKAHGYSQMEEDDLIPMDELPSEYRGDSYRAVFGFSFGEGYTKKIFVIRFQTDHKGIPIFTLSEVDDPSIFSHRRSGNMHWVDKGRTQIEMVLAVKWGLLN